MKSLVCAILATTILAVPPAGRPPVGPLERYDPQLYAVQFEIALRTRHTIRALDREQYALAAPVIAMPVIPQSTFSKSIEGSLGSRVWIGSEEVPGANEASRLENGALNTQLALIPMPDFVGFSFRWTFDQKIQVWNSRIPVEAAMADLPWPRAWPAEVGEALKPQPFIESNAPIFAKAVKTVTNDRLRMVPPYYAAKELLRYSIGQIQLNGDALREGEQSEVQGFAVDGAKYAAQRSMGTPNDLVCVCVAILKAAGIPARPVIGINYHDRKDDRQGKLRAWGEFYIDGAGWIPFDPEQMLNEGVKHMAIDAQWPGLGTFEYLNERLPLSYDFLPPGTIAPCKFLGGWGLMGPKRVPLGDQRIGFTVSELGPGTED